MGLEDVGARLITEGEAQFLASMMKAQKAVHGVGDAADKSQGPMKGMTATSLALATALGQALYNGAIMAARAVVGFATDSIAAASDLNETVSKAGVVFDQQGAAMVEWSKTSATALGMSQNAALGAAATYGNLFRSMGIGTDTSADMSKELVGLAADLASFNNLAPEEVLEKLRAGLTGEAEPLKSLGININETILKERALELGLYNGKDALTASAKAQAAYSLMLEQSTLAQGDFERTSGGLANQQRIMAANMENLKATIGTALLPVVTMAIKAFNDWLNSPGVKAGLQSLIDGIGQFVGFIQANWPIVTAIIDQFALIWKENGDEVTDTLAIIWGAVQEAFNIIVATVQSLINSIAPLVSAFLTTLTAWWKENGDQIMATVQTLWATVYELFKAALDLILTLVNFVLTNITIFWTAHGAQIMQIVTTLWTIVVGIFTTAIAVVTNIFKAFTALLRGDTEGFKTYMIAAWDSLWKAIKSAAETAWAALSTWFKGIVKAIGEFFTKTDWASVGKGIIDGIWKGLSNGWSWLITQISGLASQLLQVVKDILQIGSPSKVFEGIGMNMMIGWQKGILENATKPMGATAMATQMAVAPAAIVSGGPSTYNYSTSNTYNLGVTTSQSPQVVQNSFGLMKMLAG